MAKSKLTLLRVVGARPQFMQVKPLREELQRRGHTEVLVHTGQHYDNNMSGQFFSDLDLPEADLSLNVGSAPHAAQTGEMMRGIEQELMAHHYDAVVVDGDTNSTLAGALSAAKLLVPVVHIEAGMRSYNRVMPEEINRILTDHISTLLFTPSEIDRGRLADEGIRENVFVTGDLLTECFYHYRQQSLRRVEPLLAQLGLKKDGYVLMTMHRAEVMENPQRLQNYLQMIITSQLPVVWPMHPRAKKVLLQQGLMEVTEKAPFIVIPPQGYLDMLALESAANYILTDSGGVQREAYHWHKPCTVMRDSTEWVEIIQRGYARLIDGHTVEPIWFRDVAFDPDEYLYGKDQVSRLMVDLIEQNL